MLSRPYHITNAFHHVMKGVFNCLSKIIVTIIKHVILLTLKMSRIPFNVIVLVPKCLTQSRSRKRHSRNTIHGQNLRQTFCVSEYKISFQWCGTSVQEQRCFVSRDFRPDAAATVALESCRLVSMDISERATWRKRRVQLKR